MYLRRLMAVIFAVIFVAASGVGAQGPTEVFPAQEVGGGVWVTRSELVLPDVFVEHAVCAPSEYTACLHGGRFTVRFLMDWGSAEEVRARVYVSGGAFASFWAYGEENPEITVKVLNACAINGRYWVFAGGLTDRAFLLEVRDVYGNVAYYGKLGGYMVSWKDTDTHFPCPQ